MAENSNGLKPDIFSDKVYISKRSIRKTIINKIWYKPVETELITKAKESLSPAGCASEMNPVCCDAQQEMNECKNVSELQKAGSEPEGVSSFASLRVKLEEDWTEFELASPPEMQQEATVAKNVAKPSREHEPNLEKKKTGKPLYVFAAMKKRSMEGDAENRPYKCPYCSWAFKKSSNLLSHVETHSGLKPHVCELCGKAYAHQGTLQQHKRLHTGERPYSCPFCDKTYTWSSDHRKHIRTHTGEKPYTCTECGKEFVRSSDLRKHERNMHTNDKPFLCRACGKTFNKPLALLRHERTHLGERPFICQDCGKTFALPSRLAEHQKVHSGLRPYVCPVCTKAFTKSSNLTEHLSVHTGDRPYTCAECGVAFAMPSRLLRHQRAHATRRLQQVLQPPV